MNDMILQILKGTRKLIADPERWTQHAMARDAYGNTVSSLDVQACRWCLYGAVKKIAADVRMTRPDRDCVFQVLESANHDRATVINVNDLDGHPAVLKLLDEAIATTEKELSCPTRS